MSFQTRLAPIGLALALALPGAAHGSVHSFGLELRPPAALVDLQPTLITQAVARSDEGAADAPPATKSDDAKKADAPKSDDAQKADAPKSDKRPSKSGQAGSLDFDLLGTAAAPATQVDSGRLRLRRTMLTAHQGMGLALVGLQLATTVVGQLNYSDKFGANTEKYKQPHAVLAYADLGVFAGTGLLALLAPKPIQEDREGFDRISLHKVAMFTAATGMATQAVLGIVTTSREGYLNQKSIGTAHLVIGYVTLAAIVTGVSAIVF